MKRKLVALLLVVSMAFCMFAGCANKQEMVTTATVEVDGYDITVKESNTKREATTTVEGVPITCKHTLDSDEYWLNLSDVSYELDVQILENGIEVKFKDKVTAVDCEDVVVGQTMTMAFAVPSLIDAAKWLIVLAAGYTTIKGVAISADALGDTIKGVRNSSSTYSKARTIDIDAATAIRFGKMNKYNAYYEAYLKNNTVFISKEISQWGAIMRLESGQDVFATSQFAASYACLQASTTRGNPTYHQSKGEGYYPHYHPLGRRWVNNPNSAPHCWYPY